MKNLKTEQETGTKKCFVLAELLRFKFIPLQVVIIVNFEESEYLKTSCYVAGELSFHSFFLPSNALDYFAAK